MIGWIGEAIDGLSRWWERATVRSEQDRIAAARARAVYELRLAEQRAAKAAAAVEAARLRAMQAAEAEELYSTAEPEAKKAAEGSEP